MLVVYCVYINLIVVFTAVLCNNPGSPAHGSRSGDDFTFGKTVSYKCDPGHKITGSRSRTCTASGTWSGIEPTCTGKQGTYQLLYSTKVSFIVRMVWQIRKINSC